MKTMYEAVGTAGEAASRCACSDSEEEKEKKLLATAVYVVCMLVEAAGEFYLAFWTPHCFP